MGLIRQARPPFGRINGQPTLNWQHPLARGMTDCLLWNSLVPANLAAPTITTTLTSSPTLVPTVRGLAGYATGGSGFSIPSHTVIAAADFAIRLLFRPVTWPADFTALFDTQTRELAVFIAAATGDIDFEVIGGTTSATNSATGMTAGSVWDFVLSRTGSTVSHYVNGVAKPTSTNTGNLDAVFPLAFGTNPSGGGVNANIEYITTQIWNRALSVGEILQLYRDPYCFLSYPQDVLVNRTTALAGSTNPVFCIAGDDGRTITQMVGY